jgi:limonene-1,2-epoxide hydrolase
MPATEVETRNAQTVRTYIAAFEAKDPAGIVADCADKVYMKNGPFDATNTRDDLQALFSAFLPHVGAVKFKDLRLDAVGDMVYTERVECFGMPDGEVALPVNAIYQFDADGKIVDWREYWDLNDWLAQGGPSFDDL